MGQVTVFSGPERRRRWSDEERLQIVSEAFAPGARVADVCRRHDVSSGLIYTWRRKLLDAGVAQEASAPEALPAPVFAEAVIDGAAVPVSAAEHPAMIIEGGVPLVVEGKVIGAIGVSGVKSEEDAIVAQAGADALKPAPK